MKIIFYSVLAVFIFCNIGCNRTVYIPVETVKTEYRDRLQRDSIHLYDSIFVRIANDTVWMERYRYKYRDKLVRDSVFINDTIRIPYPVVEYREVNKLKKWQITLMVLGGILIGFVVYRITRFFN